MLLFIAVIAIANCVSAATVDLSESAATVAGDGSVRTYKLNTDKVHSQDTLVINASYSNSIVDLNKLSLAKVIVSAKNVELKNGGITNLVVNAGGEVLFSEGNSIDTTGIATVENKGTIKMGKGRAFTTGTWINEGTLVIDGQIGDLKMKAGTLTVQENGKVTLEMDNGVMKLEKGAEFVMHTAGFKGGRIESLVTLGSDDAIIADKDEYIYVRTPEEDGKDTMFYVVPKSDLEVAVKFTDTETAQTVTRLEAGKNYEVSAEVVYNGVTVTKNAWNGGFTFNSKTQNVLMPVTEDSRTVRAMQDGKAELEVVIGKDKTEIKRTINVTVGEVKNDEPEQEPEGNQPSENKGELDSTPKTGDYIEMAAAILAVDKGERNEKR